MLKTLSIRGYRSFESYRLSQLARVNLVVGKNNCGKTSLLEAVELAVSKGDPAVLYNSVARRGDMRGNYSRRTRESPIDLSHVFFGHTFDSGAHFELSSDDRGHALSVKVLSLDEVGEEAHNWERIRRYWQQRGLFDRDEEAAPIFGLSIDGRTTGIQSLLPVMEDGTVLFDRFPGSLRNGPPRLPVHFLTLDSFDPANMGQKWNAILKEGRELEIVEDMKILEPQLDSIH